MTAKVASKRGFKISEKEASRDSIRKK